MIRLVIHHLDNQDILHLDSRDILRPDSPDILHLDSRDILRLDSPDILRPDSLDIHPDSPDTRLDNRDIHSRDIRLLHLEHNMVCYVQLQ